MTIYEVIDSYIGQLSGAELDGMRRTADSVFKQPAKPRHVRMIFGMRQRVMGFDIPLEDALKFQHPEIRAKYEPEQIQDTLLGLVGEVLHSEEYDNEKTILAMNMLITVANTTPTEGKFYIAYFGRSFIERTHMTMVMSGRMLDDKGSHFLDEVS